MKQDLAFHRTLPRRARQHLHGIKPLQKIRILAYLLMWQIANAAGFVHAWIFHPRSQRPLDLRPFHGHAIVVQRRGGAGNQLFQYAATRQAARQIHSAFCFTPTDTALRRSNIQLEAFTGPLPAARSRDLLPFLLLPPGSPPWLVEWNRRLRRKLRIGRIAWKRENSIMEQIERSFWGKRLLFDAYFQDPLFFQAELSGVLDEIRVQRPSGACIENQVIAINLRTARDFEEIGWTLPLDYYHQALKALDPDCTQLVWLIGDEPFKLTGLIAEIEKAGRRAMPAPSLTGNRQWDDFWNMARAGKLIMSRSTYCWWAAAMNDHLQQMKPGRIIAPLPWLPTRAASIIPAHWARIETSS